ncbi:MAG: hypothetical protein EOO08_10505 [Chitinophagaceae bacterium]|nr:MAG: hypothetical protein EOO08_10505 [Chitinophagaceae bacterium]
MRTLLAMTACCLLALASCKKDPLPNDCPVSRIQIRPNTLSNIRTADLHYGSDGVSEVVISSGERFTLTYRNGTPVRRDYFGIDNLRFRYDSFVYNGGRTPQRVLRFEQNAAGFYVADSTEIELNNGLLSGLRNYQRASINAAWQPNLLYRFSNSGGNLSGYILDRYYGGVLTFSDTMIVLTDNEPNAFNALHPEFYLYHPVWAYEAPDHLFFQMTANNITGLTPATNPPAYFQYSYGYDAQGRLVTSTAGGVVELALSYDCR